MDVQIKTVNDKRDLKQFVKFPFSLYADNPYWVPPLLDDDLTTLNKDKNPAFKTSKAQLWTAHLDGKMVGRIVGIINPAHEKRWGQKYARFGWIDFIDDERVSAALIHTVEKWAKENGMQAVHGPLGFTDMDPEGMLLEGFDETPTIATIYNHPYYPVHLEKLGYKKDTDWVEYQIDVPTEPNPTIDRIAQIALRRNKLHLLKLKNRKELLSYAGQIFDVIEEAYQNLYGFVELSQEQIDSYIKQYFNYLSPQFVPVVADQNNTVVAFAVTMPSLSKAMQKANGKILPFGVFHLLKAMKKNNLGDLYLVGVRSQYTGKGVNAILINEMNKVYNEMGITQVESNPELEDNKSVQDQWKYFTKRQHKRRRCFIKNI